MVSIFHILVYVLRAVDHNVREVNNCFLSVLVISTVYITIFQGKQ